MVELFSSTQIAEQVKMNEWTLWNIWKRKYYPYYKLKNLGNFSRMEFCETMMKKCNDNLNFFNKHFIYRCFHCIENNTSCEYSTSTEIKCLHGNFWRPYHTGWHTGNGRFWNKCYIKNLQDNMVQITGLVILQIPPQEKKSKIDRSEDLGGSRHIWEHVADNIHWCVGSMCRGPSCWNHTFLGFICFLRKSGIHFFWIIWT